MPINRLWMAILSLAFASAKDPGHALAIQVPAQEKSSAVMAVSRAYEKDEILLWPGAAPGSEHVNLKEQIVERSSDPLKPDRVWIQITRPSLTVHRPRKANGVAAIIAPGGGYERVVIDKEGPDTTAWLNGLGITAFVLKYRLPGDGHVHGEDAPLQDAQRAMRLVRSRASRYGIDPKKIGFIGYSAGGHLALTLAGNYDQATYPSVDSADHLSARPDFLILGYASSGLIEPTPRSGARLSSDQEHILSKYRMAPCKATGFPPTFLLHANDDPTVHPIHSLTIYRLLREAGVETELHIFRKGGHGFGIRDAKGAVSRWPEMCAEWMRGLGLMR